MACKSSLYTLFEDSVKLYSNRSCVEVSTKSKRDHVKFLTYEEMAENCTKISDSLLRLAHDIDYSTVLCIIRPTLILPTVILGILKASCSFAFLDLKHPLPFFQRFQEIIPIIFAIGEKDMIEYLMKNRGMQWNIKEELKILNTELVIVQLLEASKLNNERVAAQKMISPAYVALTSGSTGPPKVVQVPHSCILPNIIHLRSIFEVTETDVIPLMSPLTFDPSIVDIFLALSSGGKLLILPETVKAAPTNLVQQLCKHQVTVMQATPSILLRVGKELLRNTLLSANSSLRVLALGGEPCPSMDLLRTFKKQGNPTRFFSLYGTTEVSCWSSYHELDFTVESYNFVPLGEPLAETVLELRNGANTSEGEVYIGSSTRVCQINGDQISKPAETIIWRATGDWAFSANNHLYFKHRLDALVKHNGRKVDLQPIQTQISRLPGVQSCILHYQSEAQELVAFVVPQNVSMVQQVEDIIMNAGRTSSWNIPLRVSVVPQLFVTKHGKADLDRLKSFASTQLLDTSYKTSEEICTVIAKLWKVYTGRNSCNPTDNFLECGGDSVSAVQMTLDLEWQMKVKFPLLTDKLLHQGFAQVTEYCITQLATTVEENQEYSPNHASKNKRFRSGLDKLNSSPEITKCFRTVSRGGKRVCCVCNSCDISTFSNSTLFGSKSKNTLKCHEKFKVNLFKCIDASPLIVEYERGSCIACIGSHSGSFCVVDLRSGKPHWMVQLPDRIESSACLSPCGKKLLVGCYDHCLYCLCIKDGKKLWQFQSGGEIKSSPVCSPNLNMVFVGSHDQHIYALTVQTGDCVWKTHIGQGSVFSSPGLSLNPPFICAASLDGSVMALELETGKALWHVCLEKPVFSSPLIIEGKGVCVASVSGKLAHYNVQGEQVWMFTTDGAIFCSPALLEDRVLIGSHSNSFYCLNVETGTSVWMVKLNSPIYATPCAIPEENVVVVVATDGTMKLVSGHSGEEVLSLQYPGQVFSSPLFFKQWIVVGCRDNYLYCHSLQSL